MKKKLIMLMVCLVMVLIVVTACDKTEETPIATATPKPTDSAERTLSPEPTATPTPKPTIVPLSEEQKGKPQENFDIIYEETYEDDDLVGQIHNEANVIIEDGEMIFLSEAAGGGGYYVDFEYELYDKYNQYEYTFETYSELSENNTPPWSSLFVGIRVQDLGSIGGAGGGFWFSINNLGYVHIYPGGKDENFPDVTTEPIWNLCYKSLESPVNFAEKRKLTLIDAGDSIFLYVDIEGELTLIFKAVFQDDKLLIYKADSSLAYEFVNVVNDYGTIKFWDHYGKTSIDNLTIKGAK